MHHILRSQTDTFKKKIQKTKYLAGMKQTIRNPISFTNHFNVRIMHRKFKK